MEDAVLGGEALADLEAGFGVCGGDDDDGGQKKGVLEEESGWAGGEVRIFRVSQLTLELCEEVLIGGKEGQ